MATANKFSADCKSLHNDAGCKSPHDDAVCMSPRGNDDEQQSLIVHNGYRNSEQLLQNNLCQTHNCLLEFWCLFCDEASCKKCLRLFHKKCEWILVEERLNNVLLEKEFEDSYQFYKKRLQNFKSNGSTNSMNMVSLKVLIYKLECFLEELQYYHGSLEVAHCEANNCIDSIMVCKQEIPHAAEHDLLKILLRKVNNCRELEELLGIPKEPMSYLMQFVQAAEDEVMLAKRGRVEFPDTLQGFGYDFKGGRLTQLSTGGGFEFMVRDGDQSYNQQHYEALGEVITEHVYGLLSSECNLTRLPVPMRDPKQAPSSYEPAQGFIFVSANWATNPNLLLLINGSGVVRAGQWARRLIMNDCLNSGTQMPYIKRALREGYDVMVLNTNQKLAKDGSGKLTPIKYSETPLNHADYVWRNYVTKAAAKNIAIVAHSYGGVVTTHLFQKFRDFKHRVFAVAFTDSVHSVTSSRSFEPFTKIARNWTSSSLPLDAEITYQRAGDVDCVSAGSDTHEMTSWSSFRSVFQFIKAMLEIRTGTTIPAIPEDEYSTDLPAAADNTEEKSKVDSPAAMSAVTSAVGSSSETQTDKTNSQTVASEDFQTSTKLNLVKTPPTSTKDANSNVPKTVEANTKSVKQKSRKKGNNQNY